MSCVISDTINKTNEIFKRGNQMSTELYMKQLVEKLHTLNLSIHHLTLAVEALVEVEEEEHEEEE